MIMPCVNSTSACDRGGSAALVEGGSVLLGLPGAPGCTITGGGAESTCCARAGEENKPVVTFAASSTPHSNTDALAALNPFARRKLYISPFASHLNIFSSLTLKGRGETQRRKNPPHTFKNPRNLAESGQAGVAQTATVTAAQNITCCVFRRGARSVLLVTSVSQRRRS